MVNRIRKPRQEGHDDATLERRLLVMSADDTMDDGISDLVLNLHLVHYGSGTKISTLAP